MEEIAFFVPGVPAPQGSKTRTAWGLREDNPRTRPWREAVAWTAIEHTPAELPAWLDGPVAVHLRFTFPRPKAHYRTGGNRHLLKDSAPLLHTNKPDIDKLCRAALDSLTTSRLLRDDCVCAVLRAEKGWGDLETVPGMEVRLRSAGKRGDSFL